MKIEERHLNGNGVVHGGVVMTVGVCLSQLLPLLWPQPALSRLTSRWVCALSLTQQLLDDVTWLGMQTLGVPKVGSVSTNIACEFVRPSGRLGEYLYMVTEPVKIGELH